MSSWNFVFMLQLLCIISFHHSKAESENHSKAESENTVFNSSLTCTLVQNGTFIKDPAACDKWIQCINRTPISGSCADGLFYNKDTNQCVHPNSIKCYSSKPCADVTTDGSFTGDPYSCNSYYYCSNGTGTLGLCSSGLNYNAESQECIQNFPCTSKPNPDSWCNIIPDGQFFAAQYNCSQYHLCRNGILENGTCPQGYYFNGLKSLCDYESDVECNQPGAHEIRLSGRGICQGDGEFLSDNRTCSGYFYCQKKPTGDFEMIWNKCSSGMFFDQSNGGECGDRRLVECNYDRCVGMGMKRIQLINAQADGCRTFLICQNGKTIGNGVCPNNEQFFDEVLQGCTKNVVEYPVCLNSTAKVM